MQQALGTVLDQDLTQGQASSLSGSEEVGKLVETYFEGALS